MGEIDPPPIRGTEGDLLMIVALFHLELHAMRTRKAPKDEVLDAARLLKIAVDHWIELQGFQSEH